MQNWRIILPKGVSYLLSVILTSFQGSLLLDHNKCLLLSIVKFVSPDTKVNNIIEMPVLVNYYEIFLPLMLLSNVSKENPDIFHSSF